MKILHSLDYEVWLEGNKVNLSGSVNDKISKMPKRLTSIIEIKEILDYLEDAPLSSDEDIISSIIRKLKQPRFEDNKVIAFIVEQLSLLHKSPRQRRYSPSMLPMTCMLERMSPSCYNQMYRDAWIILPTADYLRRLTSAINVDLDISPSTISYLTARFSILAKKDKVVSLLMDEVYSRKMVQYTNAKFYGIENGAPTRTVCVMLKSVTGRYRDEISMSPICNINADKLYEVWSNVIKVASEIGFDIVVTMADGYSANVKLFKTKLLCGIETPCVPNPWVPNQNIYLLYDTVHFFKNAYNNFVNKENLSHT